MPFHVDDFHGGGGGGWLLFPPPEDRTTRKQDGIGEWQWREMGRDKEKRTYEIWIGKRIQRRQLILEGLGEKSNRERYGVCKCIGNGYSGFGEREMGCADALTRDAPISDVV